MPYFERKSLAELQATLARGLQDTVPSNSSVGVPALVQQAAAILEKESRSAPRWQPPVSTPALSWPNLGFAPAATGIVPVLLQTPPVRPGESAEISLSLINDSSEDVPYSFNFTDLISPAGERIPYTAIRANPAAATVAPRSTGSASFEIQIPAVSPGCYFGLATCRETQPAVLTVTVSS